jgi:Iron-containing redox enzyme
MKAQQLFTTDNISLLDFDSMLSMDSRSVDGAFLNEKAKDELFSRVKESCERAYNEGDPESLYLIQYMLFRIYQLHINIAPPGAKMPESSTILLGIRNLIEGYFEDYEDSLVPASLWYQMPRDSSAYVSWLIENIHNHPAYNHSLYTNHLGKKASIDDLRIFLNQEMTIDARFDDFLALIQLGTKDMVKLEIAANYWDEMGNGDRAKMHANMFVRTMESLGGGFEVGQLTTESFICGNLALMLSLRRASFYKAIGYFAVTEYLAPSRFKHVITACERNGLDSTVAEYHQAHIDIDGSHSNRWFSNVVCPVIDEFPDAAEAITRGAFYRLNTSQRYLDELSRRLTPH